MKPFSPPAKKGGALTVNKSQAEHFTRGHLFTARESEHPQLTHPLWQPRNHAQLGGHVHMAKLDTETSFATPQAQHLKFPWDVPSRVVTCSLVCPWFPTIWPNGARNLSAQGRRATAVVQWASSGHFPGRATKLMHGSSSSELNFP